MILPDQHRLDAEIAFSGSGSAAPGVQGKEHRAHTVCLLQSRAFQADFVNASSRQSRQRAPAIPVIDLHCSLGIKRELWQSGIHLVPQLRV